MGMCESWWPSRIDENNGECANDAVEERNGEHLCQDHVNVDNAREFFGLGPLLG